ncbi:MAG: hypothetical protein QXZ44_05335 [Ferroplasma sp.]
MHSKYPFIWFKNNLNPEFSLSNSIWIALHSNMYNYVQTDNYLIRHNKINKILEYSHYAGFIDSGANFKKLQSAINSGIRHLKIKEFSAAIIEDNDFQKAINYMENGRTVITGIPLKEIENFTNYKVAGYPFSNSTYYFATAMLDGKLIFIPEINTDEVKMPLDQFYSKFNEFIKSMDTAQFREKYAEIKSACQFLYISVLKGGNEEVRSLNEF